jgi:hypothetical protein
MAPPNVDDDLEALLSADDEPAKPEPEEAPVTGPEPQAKAEAEAPAEGTAKSESKPPGEKPKPAARPATAGTPQRDSGWMVWALTVLLLLLTVIGVGWYANEQRMQVKDLKDQVETAKTQATGTQATAGGVADDLAPLVEEQLAIAKVREAAGDAEGAKYALLLAKRYADMADKLSGQTPSGKLQELQAQIEEAGTTTVQSPEPRVQSPEAKAVQSPESGVQSSTTTTTPDTTTAPAAEGATPASAAGAGAAPAATTGTQTPATEATATEGRPVPPGG